MHPRPASPRPLGSRVRLTPAAGAGAGRGAAPRPDRPGPEPLRVLVDGRNVQGAFERGVGPGSMPTGTLISRLRAAFPPPVEVELILDGHRGGSPSGRIAPGFSVAFTRDLTADVVIAGRVAEALRVLGPAGAWSVVVVTDDREVRDHARRNGARVEGTAWLAARMAGPSGAAARPGTSFGGGRPPGRGGCPPGRRDRDRDLG